MQGVQRCDLVEDCQPARRRTTVAEYVRHDLVLHDIARDQGPVRFDKRELIPFGVRAAEPEQTRHHTAQIDLRLGLERWGPKATSRLLRNSMLRTLPWATLHLVVTSTITNNREMQFALKYSF
jgi:hypothetical protein